MNKAQRIAAAVATASAIAIPAEGLRRVAYLDPPGILTVCYGSTTNVEKGKVYSLEECRARLDRDMLDAIETVERCAPGLPAPVLAAFGDAVYNIGPTVACNKSASTAARLLASGDIAGAFVQHADNLIDATALGADVDRAWLDDQDATALMELAFKVVEVNADFFARTLLPKIADVAGKIEAAMPAGGTNGLPSSLATGSDSRP